MEIVLDRVFTCLIVAVAVLIGISMLRNRRATYQDIEASEVNPEVAAGEELLHDVLLESQLSQQHGHPHERERVI